MKPYVFLDVEGYVMRSGSGLTLPEGALAAPDGLTALDLLDYRVVNDAFEKRPSLPDPEVKAWQGNGRAFQFLGLPDATTAEITDTLIGHSMATLSATAGVIDIELIDAGLYRIQLEPPRPWLPMTVAIEVAA